MTNQPPLNPDALEAMSRVMNPPAWDMIDREPEDELVIMIKKAELGRAERLVAAYLAVAQPVAQKITDAEWQAFQAIPDQGYSHRAWIDARIAERLAAAQPEVKP